MTKQTNWFPFASAALIFYRGHVVLDEEQANKELANVDTTYDTTKIKIDLATATWTATFERDLKHGDPDTRQKLEFGPRDVFERADVLDRDLSLFIETTEVKEILKNTFRELDDLPGLIVDDLKRGELIGRGILESQTVHGRDRELIPTGKWQLYELIDPVSGVFKDRHGKSIFDVEISSSEETKSLLTPSPELPKHAKPVRKEELRCWYEERYRTWQGGQSNRDQDLEDAREHFDGRTVDRYMLRELRKEIAPDWANRGRRKSNPDLSNN